MRRRTPVQVRCTDGIGFEAADRAQVKREKSKKSVRSVSVAGRSSCPFVARRLVKDMLQVRRLTAQAGR